MIERHCKPAHWRSRNSLLAALIAGCAAIAPATAGTIGIDSSGTLVIGAEASDPFVNLMGIGDGTNFTLTAVAGAFDIVTLNTGSSGCSLGITGMDFICSGFTSLLVIGSYGEDVLDFSVASVRATLAGGLGDDVIFGTTVNDFIYGGSGDDKLFGATGDSFFGGPGTDLVFVDGSLDPGVGLGEDNPQFDPLPRPPVAVPEPSSMLLLLAGLGATVLTNFRVKRRALRYC